MAPTKFSEFLEARMEEHRRQMHAIEREEIAAIIDEVQELPKRKPKSGRLFDVPLDPTQRTVVVRQ